MRLCGEADRFGGQSKAEYRAAAGMVPGGKEAAVGFDNALTHGQADAHTSGRIAGQRAGHGLAGLYGLTHLRRQPPAPVPHLHHSPVLLAVQAQGDVFCVARVADCVFQQVNNDLFYQQCVHGQIEDVL